MTPENIRRLNSEKPDFLLGNLQYDESVFEGLGQVANGHKFTVVTIPDGQQFQGRRFPVQSRNDNTTLWHSISLVAEQIYTNYYKLGDTTLAGTLNLTLDVIEETESSARDLTQKCVHDGINNLSSVERQAAERIINFIKDTEIDIAIRGLQTLKETTFKGKQSEEDAIQIVIDKLNLLKETLGTYSEAISSFDAKFIASQEDFRRGAGETARDVVDFTKRLFGWRKK